jgi:RNA polymerase sigma factor (sigma-70 family)
VEGLDYNATMDWLLEDPQRLVGYRRGDPEMLTAAYLHYAPRLARVLASGVRVGEQRVRLDSPFELDDVVQESLMRAFGPNARRDYDDGQPFFRYLTTIARNLLIDRGRKAARRFERVSTPELEIAPSVATHTPETSALRRELRSLYREFVDSLEPVPRLVWRQRVEQGETRRAVEEATGLSAMGVRTLEAQLRRELVRRLDQAGYGAEVDALGWTGLLGVVL